MTEPKWWDFTLSKDKAQEMFIDDMEMLGRILKPKCDRCVVGDEEGADGYKHYQGRCVFKKGVTLTELRMMLPSAHWTPTHVRNFDYCEKEGKFWRSWEEALGEYVGMELLRWQEKTMKLLETQSDRSVLVIIDTEGGKGKTTLAKIMVSRHIGAYCPAMEDAKDYMAWALAHQTAKTFILDIPRAEDRKKDKQLWSAVEQMKNGYLWDKRNHWQEAWIEPPKVLVFTNSMPDKRLLSDDRWDIHYLEKVPVTGEYALI